MAGHSKWKQIKHKKAKNDAERGKIFTKLIKEITVAARQGGGDEASNAALRSAIQAAKDANMPQSNIERAIKKGTGELPGVSYEEVVYEGYGPGGAALMIECVTDNKNRTVADMRHIFSKCNGNLGENGSVAWMFEKRGEITIFASDPSEDRMMELALESGADDLLVDGDVATLACSPEELENVKSALEASGVKYESAELTMAAKNVVKVEGTNAKQTLKLIEMLEDHDDVQNVYSNFDIASDVFAELS